LKSHLDQLDQRISELKLDVSKTSSEYLDSDSRPSSGNAHVVGYSQACGARRTGGCQLLSKTCWPRYCLVRSRAPWLRGRVLVWHSTRCQGWWEHLRQVKSVENSLFPETVEFFWIWIFFLF